MEESFYATMKLVTGEEVLAEVTSMSENNVDFFLVNDPIVINETMQVDAQKGVAVSGLVPRTNLTSIVGFCWFVLFIN